MKRGLKASINSLFGAVNSIATAVETTADVVNTFASATKNVAEANAVISRNWREIAEAQAGYRLRKRKLKLSKKIAELEAE
jgi:uncharacterized protein YoxC